MRKALFLIVFFVIFNLVYSSEFFYKLNSTDQMDFAIDLYNHGFLDGALEHFIAIYNNERTPQGKMCCGRTPMQTLEDGKQIWQEKFIA